MRRKTNDGAVSLGHQRVLYLVFSIVIPLLLMTIMILSVLFLVRDKIYDYIDGNLEYTARRVGNTPTLTATEVLDEYPNHVICYYDAAGKIIRDRNHGNAAEWGPESIDDFHGNFSSVNRDGVDYRACFVHMSIMVSPAANDAKSAIIFLDISNEIFIYESTMAICAVVLFVALALNIVIALTFSAKQLKPYEEALRKNNQLISDISHEFNTPLAIVSANVSNIMSSPDKTVEDVSENLACALDETNRLKRMVKDMLILSRFDNDRMILEEKPCDVSKIVREISEPFAEMCKLEDKKMNIDIAPDIQCVVDGDKIKQMVIILLDNAMKYTTEGDEIVLSVTRTATRYTITVSDSGPGVPDKDAEHVFERFWRADNSRSSGTGGAGLGLAIVKAITTNMNGKVSASRNRPHGFRVDIELGINR